MKKIPLSQGKFALVDDEDYEMLMQWKWSIQKRGFHLGLFITEELAARAYDSKARELFGEFAKLNFNL